MFGKISIVISVILFVSGLVAPPVFAQATFSVGSANVTGTDIGLTELTGAITLTITSGTSVEAPFAIKYSALITNNSKDEIFVTGTGGLSPIPWAPTLDRTNNTIVINVPAGGVVGNRIEIAGVRVTLAGQNYTSVTATITSTSAGGNALVAGQTAPTVIGSILKPLSAKADAAHPLLWTNGQVTNPSTSFNITEGYAGAFTDNIGSYGQTVPTEVRVTPFPSIPAGVKLTLAATATSLETGATLTTLSTAAETIPRADGSTDVTYAFSAKQLSPSTVETFPIQIAVTLESGSRASGTVTFQAELVPIGIAVPNKEFPSTDIPRYTERLVPDESDLITGSTKLAFPFRIKSDGTYTGIAVTNPQNYRVDVTLTAYDSAGNVITGAGITNPVNLTLPRRGQLAKVATEIFGTAFNTATSGTIIVDGKTPLLEGFYLVGDEVGSRLDGSIADISPFEISMLPAVFHQGPSPYNFIDIYNPGTSAANVQVRLYDTNGTAISTVALPAIKAGGSLARDLTQVFATVDLSSFSGGYIMCRSDAAVVARETFGNSLDSNVLTAQSGLKRKSIPIAHFAQGGGYVTELNLVNADAAVNAEVTLTALDNSGAPLAIPANPVNITIKPGAQLTQGLQELFPALDSSLTTGSLQMDIKASSTGPFVTVPPVLGSIRFSSAEGYSSASLPTILPVSSDFVYSQVAQALGYYTGIALLNTNTTMTSVTLDVYKADGSWVGVSTITLLPGQKVSRLLYEFIPTTLGQVGGYIHVHASQPVMSFALFGTDDGKSLSAIPPQPID